MKAQSVCGNMNKSKMWYYILYIVLYTIHIWGIIYIFAKHSEHVNSDKYSKLCDYYMLDNIKSVYMFEWTKGASINHVHKAGGVPKPGYVVYGRPQRHDKVQVTYSYRGSLNSGEICPKIFACYPKPRCLNRWEPKIVL